MNMPSSACIGEVGLLTLQKYNGGFDIPSFQNIREKLWLRKRYALKHSDHDKIRQLWRDTACKCINTDCLIQDEEQNISQATTSMHRQQVTEATKHFFGLESQGVMVKVVTQAVTKKTITLWSNTVNELTALSFKFVRKAFQQLLPTAANLVR